MSLPWIDRGDGTWCVHGHPVSVRGEGGTWVVRVQDGVTGTFRSRDNAMQWAVCAALDWAAAMDAPVPGAAGSGAA